MLTREKVIEQFCDAQTTLKHIQLDILFLLHIIVKAYRWLDAKIVLCVEACKELKFCSYKDKYSTPQDFCTRIFNILY